MKLFVGVKELLGFVADGIAAVWQCFVALGGCGRDSVGILVCRGFTGKVLYMFDTGTMGDIFFLCFCCLLGIAELKLYVANGIFRQLLHGIRMSLRSTSSSNDKDSPVNIH